jgi:hypothetical protein
LVLTTPDGEQLPMEFIARMIPITVYVTLAIALITLPIYKVWVRKYWYKQLLVILLCSAFACVEIITRLSEDGYNMSIETINVNGTDYEKTTKYYDSNSTVIRSISFTRNNKKDSTFTIYAKDGSIIQQRRYKNGTLLPAPSK